MIASFFNCLVEIRMMQNGNGDIVSKFIDIPSVDGKTSVSINL